jgi:hypothetical protein
MSIGDVVFSQESLYPSEGVTSRHTFGVDEHEVMEALKDFVVVVLHQSEFVEHLPGGRGFPHASEIRDGNTSSLHVPIFTLLSITDVEGCLLVPCLPVSLVSPSAVMLEELSMSPFEHAPAAIGIVGRLEDILADQFEVSHVSPPSFSSTSVFLIDLETFGSTLSENPVDSTSGEGTLE